MSVGVTSGPGTTADPQGRRLESWKEIAAYLGRDITTVRRWEKREGLPVHRHQHSRLGTVYAYTAELDAWRRERAPVPAIGEMALVRGSALRWCQSQARVAARASPRAARVTSFQWLCFVWGGWAAVNSRVAGAGARSLRQASSSAV